MPPCHNVHNHCSSTVHVCIFCIWYTWLRSLGHAMLHGKSWSSFAHSRASRGFAPSTAKSPAFSKVVGKGSFPSSSCQGLQAMSGTMCHHPPQEWSTFDIDINSWQWLAKHRSRTTTLNNCNKCNKWASTHHEPIKTYLIPILTLDATRISSATPRPPSTSPTYPHLSQGPCRRLHQLRRRPRGQHAQPLSRCRHGAQVPLAQELLLQTSLRRRNLPFWKPQPLLNLHWAWWFSDFKMFKPSQKNMKFWRSISNH